MDRAITQGRLHHVEKVKQAAEFQLPSFAVNLSL